MRKEAKTHSCCVCHIKMPAVEALSNNNRWYCKECLNEVANRQWFARQVCEIFGLKVPGARLYAERKRLREKYGYTDETIVETLRYAIDIKKIKCLSVSLYLVTPELVDEMTRVRRKQDEERAKARAMVSDAFIEPKKILLHYDSKQHPIYNIQPEKIGNWDDLLGEDGWE